MRVECAFFFPAAKLCFRAQSLTDSEIPADAPPPPSGILIGKLKQIKRKTRGKLKDIWDFSLSLLVQRMSKFLEIGAK